MTALRFRSPAAVLSAIVTAVALAVAPTWVFGMEKFLATIALRAEVGWIMSGTGVPDPTVGDYISQVKGLYLQPPSPLFHGQPTFPGYHFEGLTTPEQFCPFVCLPPPAPQLTFGESLARGVTILDNTIVPPLQDGDDVAVLGYSQSATIASEEMNDLVAAPSDGLTPSELDDLHVVLLGDPNSPIGGILDRFQFPPGVEPFSFTPAPQHVPFVNIPLSTEPTPTEDIPTAIYTAEYDGWANFPQDMTNILAVINALVGIITVHPYYPDFTADQLASVIDVGTIGNAHFYEIPQNLPILQFMYNGGTAGQFFGDFFSPWLRLIIDWAYGNAGDPAVNGFHPIPDGPFIQGSPYEQAVGVAGGPWPATPLGELYDGSDFISVDESGVAGLFEKMDPLQMLAGVENALVQSLIGPWVDVAAAAGPLSDADIDIITDIGDTFRWLLGYDLINSIDQALLSGWVDLADQLDLTGVIGPEAVLDGPLIPGQPLIGLVGAAFDIFNFFGA